MLKSQPATLCISIALLLGLAACGRNGQDPAEPSAAAAKPDQASPATNVAAPPADKAVGASPADEANPQAADAKAVFTLSNGPDVCFRAVAKHFGADIQVSEITSFFSAGKDIEPSHAQPAGEMTTCTVQYQDPNDPRKLVESRLDLDSGQFGPPIPIEISVSGGNAADFKLEDYLIPLSKVDAAALTSVMEAQKSRLSGVFSRYAWSGVRLSAPGAFSNVHTLRLDLAGRLASNDIKQGGYASVSVDGKKITKDHLMP